MTGDAGEFGAVEFDEGQGTLQNFIDFSGNEGFPGVALFGGSRWDGDFEETLLVQVGVVVLDAGAEQENGEFKPVDVDFHSKPLGVVDGKGRNTVGGVVDLGAVLAADFAHVIAGVNGGADFGRIGKVHGDSLVIQQWAGNSLVEWTRMWLSGTQGLRRLQQPQTSQTCSLSSQERVRDISFLEASILLMAMAMGSWKFFSHQEPPRLCGQAAQMAARCSASQGGTG